MNNVKWWARTAIGIAAGLLALTPFTNWLSLGSVSAATSSPVTTAIVTKIVDGDTLEVEIAGTTERVRLIGIDTPESVSTSTPKQCFGEEAALALKGLVVRGDVVTISADAERRDRYGRMLLYVYGPDGTFLNEWLLASGFADVLFYEPNTALRSQFTATATLPVPMVLAYGVAATAPINRWTKRRRALPTQRATLQLIPLVSRRLSYKQR